MLFFRGEGMGWLVEIGYSRNAAQILIWIGSAYVFRYFEKGGARYIVLAAITVLLGISIHIISAVIFAFVLLSIFIYTTITHSGSGWRARFWKLLPAIAAGMALPLAVRIIHGGGGLNPIHTHRQGMLIISSRLAMIDPAELLFGFSPAFIFAFLTLPFFFVAASERARRTLIGIMFAVPVLVVINPITGVYLENALGYLYYRILHAAPLMCYLSLLLVGLVRVLIYGRFGPQGKGPRQGGAMISAYTGAKRKRSRQATIASAIGARVLAAALIGSFIVIPLRLSIFSTIDKTLGIIKESGLPIRDDARRMAERIQRTLPSRSIIASDPVTSYLVSAYSDHFIAVTLDQHGSPSDSLALERIEGIRDLFDPGVMLDDSMEWLKRNGVDYLILCEDESRISDFFGTIKRGATGRTYEKFKKSGGALTEIDSIACYRIFAVEKSDLDKSKATEVIGKPSAGEPCPGIPGDLPERITFDEGIVLDAIQFEQDRYAPGDTLKGYICWSIPENVSFGLPIEWTLRMDTDFRKGPYYRRWYGKQYRRIIERRKGRFYRFSRSQRIISGFSTPDQWNPGSRYRQDFSIALSPWLSEGRYEMRISVHRVTYLPNRSIADYLLNEDSFHGEIVGAVHVSEGSEEPRIEGH
jgi:hypothetical protein